MTTRQTKAKSAMQKRTRQKPGSTGKGEYYHVEIQSKTGFEAFRTQDVGTRGHLQRVAGKRKTGKWVTVKWLIAKEDAHIQGKKLIPDTRDAKQLIKQLGSQPVLVKGSRFKVKAQNKT